MIESKDIVESNPLEIVVEDDSTFLNAIIV